MAIKQLAKTGKAFASALPRWLWMIPLLLLTTLMAAQGINADLIWYDELTSIGHAGGLTGPYSPLDIANSVSEHSPKHSPLFFTLLAGWAAMLGWHHAVLRCLSLFFGLLAIAWTYRIGRDFLDTRAAFWACAFLGLNVYWLEYLHEIRMYPLQAFFIAALAWHYLWICRTKAPKHWFHWLGLALYAALALYAQPFSILFHLALGIFHLLFVRKSKVWFQVGLAFAAAALLYIPWLPVTLYGLTRKFDTAFDALSLEQALSVFTRLLSNGMWPLLLLPLAGVLLALRDGSWRRRLQAILLLALLALFVLLATNELIGLIPLRRSRYFLMTWGMFSLVIGAGLAWYKPRWLAPVFIIAYLAAGFSLRNADDYLDMQGTIVVVKSYPALADYVEALRGKTQAQDFVLGFTNAGFVNRAGKSGKSTAQYYTGTLLGLDSYFLHFSYQADRLNARMPALLDGNPYLLLVYDALERPPNLEHVEQYLLREYQACHIVLDGPRFFARRYVHRALSCEREYQPIHYDNGIRIVDKFAEYHPDEETLRIVTGWEVAHPRQLQSYNVSLQIITPDWQNVRQGRDRHLYDEVLKWHVVDLSTAALPPGEYRAVVILYDRYHSSAKVHGVDLNSGGAGTILPVHHFSIEA